MFKYLFVFFSFFKHFVFVFDWYWMPPDETRWGNELSSGFHLYLQNNNTHVIHFKNSFHYRFVILTTILMKIKPTIVTCQDVAAAVTVLTPTFCVASFLAWWAWSTATASSTWEENKRKPVIIGNNRRKSLVLEVFITVDCHLGA